MRKTLILLFFLFLFTKSSNSVQNEYKHLEESNNNVSYEIPVDDDKTIIFKGTGIITVSIAKAAQNKKKIIIEEGITEIENKAFYQSSLRRKDEEFNYEEVELPCSLVRIGYLSFKTQGHELKTVHFPKIDSKSDPESFYSLREIGDYAFSGQPLIEHNIPNTFIELGNNAFESSQLKHIKLNHKLNKISNYAFLFCQSLSEIEIPSSVTNIGTSSFESCSSLHRFSWTSNEVKEFGYNAFYGCVSLCEFSFPTRGSGFCGHGFFFENCVKLFRCELPSEIEGEIGRGSFLNCVSLKEVTMPKNVVRVPSDFMRNTSIEFAYLPASVSSIGTKAFSDCKRLRYVHISNRGRVELEAQVFAGSGNIEVAVIEGNVTRIEEKNLKAKILCYNGIENPSITDDSFDTHKTKIFLTNDFAEKNKNKKFGNSSSFVGYDYQIQNEGTCRLPDQNNNHEKEDKSIKILTILLIVFCVLAALSIAAVVVVLIITRKKNNAQVIEDQNSISDNLNV